MDMKKYVCLILLVLLITNCKSQEIIYLDDLPSESDLAIINIHLGEENSLLTFVKEFENDKVLVASVNKVIFNDNVSTDENLGVSKGIEFLKSTDYLKITIDNGREIKINNNGNYRFIYFYKEGKNYIIKYSKKPFIFR